MTTTFVFAVLLALSPTQVSALASCQTEQQVCQGDERDPFGKIQEGIRKEYLKTHPSWDSGFGSDVKWREAGDNWVKANNVCDAKYRACLAEAEKAKSAAPIVNVPPVTIVAPSLPEKPKNVQIKILFR